jgi:hypothetical protein
MNAAQAYPSYIIHFSDRAAPLFGHRCSKTVSQQEPRSATRRINDPSETQQGVGISNLLT